MLVCKGIEIVRGVPAFKLLLAFIDFLLRESCVCVVHSSFFRLLKKFFLETRFFRFDWFLFRA